MQGKSESALAGGGCCPVALHDGSRLRHSTKCDQSVTVLCRGELYQQKVLVFPAPRARPARPAVPARPAALAAQGRHSPAAATGPSSSLITQYHAWKMGGMWGGRCGEGNVEKGVTRGAGTLVRRTAFPGYVCPQMSVCVRAQRVLASLTPNQGRKCA